LYFGIKEEIKIKIFIPEQKMKHKRIVIKVGTHSICERNGFPSLSKISRIGMQIAELMEKNIEVVLVSSGAVGTGAKILLNSVKPKTLDLKQACASVGQPVLMSIYREFFGKMNVEVGQILLTGDVITNRERFLNAKNTFEALLKKKVLPIVNENDSVAVDEIKFGDNDNLSVNVAAIIDADGVFILSDIDGLFKNFGEENQELIDEVHEINQNIKDLIKTTKGGFSTGGMFSKISAAQKSLTMGIPLVILPGHKDNILLNLILHQKKAGTTFLPISKINQKKKWIFLHYREQGKIAIDRGAKEALLKGKSLLPVGIKDVSGKFKRGDIVGIYYDSLKVGKGICNYSSEELLKISGISSDKIEKVLGYPDMCEAIHTDHLILVTYS